MKKFKQVYIVYVIIIITFVIYIVANTIRFINIQPFDGYTLESIYRSVFVYGVFRLVPLFLVSVIAIFYKSKISWMAIMVYFYFIIWQIISYTLYFSLLDGSSDKYIILILILILSISFFSIYIMNRISTFYSIYSLEKKSVMLYNLIAFIIGFSISLLLAITNNSRYYDGL